MDYDVIIIGAGMSGLAAGIRLAYYDCKVCILEKHYLWGGLNSFYRKRGGYRFDVGLHAVTNYVSPAVRSAPLNRVYRQLRIAPQDFDLHEQLYSQVAFPAQTLTFTNDFSAFKAEVMEKFPREADGFLRLIKHINDHNDLDLRAESVSAQSIVRRFLNDRLLIEMIFCPLMYYGSARPDDMDYGQFVIMFKSIFQEGLSRPFRGVRQILEVLVAKYKELGGVLRTRAGVKSLEVAGDRVGHVVLESGEILFGNKIISSAGLIETLALLSKSPLAPHGQAQAGQLTFMESIFVLDCPAKDLGFGASHLFFNNRDSFRYRPPDDDLVDAESGVICCPNNYKFTMPLANDVIRITNIANYSRWSRLEGDSYYEAKRRCLEQSMAAIRRYIPDLKSHTVFVDSFTPKTIKKFTGHINGAVYGSPCKRKDGRTHLSNLFLCGTDQGWHGVVGALSSGITMANLHVLQAPRR
jgi:phytoene dehydrogenase-like protein